jgi:hypothetical protein
MQYPFDGFWWGRDTPYDYDSIMHFASEDYQKKKGLYTILKKVLNTALSLFQDCFMNSITSVFQDGTTIGQNKEMSKFDKHKLRTLYKDTEVCKFFI